MQQNSVWFLEVLQEHPTYTPSFYNQKPNVMSTKTATSKGKVKAKPDAADELMELLEDGLQDIYWAEKHLTKALPKMKKNATSPKLKKAIEDHLSQTEEHVTRLEKVFESLGKKAKTKKCEAMVGLLKEGEEILEETENGAVRDAGIIAAAQKVEHYEIATYGTLATYAKLLGKNEALDLLVLTLEEEKKADKLLTSIAKKEVNIEAV